MKHHAGKDHGQKDAVGHSQHNHHGNSNAGGKKETSTSLSTSSNTSTSVSKPGNSIVFVGGHADGGDSKEDLSEFVDHEANVLTRGLTDVARNQYTSSLPPDDSALIASDNYAERRSNIDNDYKLETEMVGVGSSNDSKETELNQVDVEASLIPIKYNKPKQSLAWEEKTTLFKTILNMLNYILGIIIFTMPYCIRTGGMSSFIAMLVGSLLMYFTANNIITMLLYYNSNNSSININIDSHGVRTRIHGYLGLITQVLSKNYSTGSIISKDTFHNGLRNLSLVLIVFELYFNVILYFIFGGKLLYSTKFMQDILDKYINSLLLSKLCVIVVVLVVLPTFYFRNLSTKPVIRYFGLISIVLACSLVYFDVFFGKAANNGDHFGNGEFFTNFVDFGSNMGCMFAIYSIHSIIPNFYDTMKNPKQIKTGINVVWFVLLFFQITIGIAGFWAYGLKSDLVVTANIERAYTIIVAIFLFFKVWSFPALCLHPVALVVGTLAAAVKQRKSFISMRRKSQQVRRYTQSYSTYRVVAIYCFLVLLALGIAVGFPDLVFVINIIGSCFAMPLGLIIPCIMYIHFSTKMKQKRHIESLSVIESIKVKLCWIIIFVTPFVIVWNLVSLIIEYVRS